MAALLSTLAGAGLLEALPARHATAPAPIPARSLARQTLLSLPLAAQGPVSATLGADSAAYRIAASPGALTARNPAQRLRSSFSAAGVSVSAGVTRLGLRVTGLGYGSHLVRVGRVAPSAQADRVTYLHAGLDEWYANGPLGLEQGFTIARPPAGRAAGPLTLAIAPTGNTTASLAHDGRSVRFAHAGGPSLDYTGLTATDARGRSVRSWISLQGGRVLLHVDSAGAVYPLRVDPFVQQESFGEGYASFGYTVALNSADGNTALVAGSGAEEGQFPGAVWVFVRSGSTWKQQGEPLKGGEEVGEEPQFGFSLALSEDGNTALIGGPDDHGRVGAAWVFTRSGEKWTQQGTKLTGVKEEGPAKFGWSVSLAANGNTALVGGPADEHGAHVGGEEIGAAWVFTRSGGTWTDRKKIVATGEKEEGGFGWGVALSGEGTTAIVGAPLEESTGTGVGEVGSAYVFTGSGESWSQQGEKLTGVGESGEGDFGTSVALSSAGSTALVGAPLDGDVALSGNDVGAAFVFTRSGSTWSQQGEKLTGGGEVGAGRFGHSVALSPSGETAIIGAPLDNASVGAAWEFVRGEAGWTQEGSKLSAAAQPSGRFGWSVALSPNTALIGEPQEGSDEGFVFFYVTGPTAITKLATEPTPSSGVLNATVNPDGEAVTACTFEYGLTSSYGSTASCSPKPGSGTSPVAVSAAISGLTANTTYHFRVVAGNALGTSDGADQTFTTLQTSNTAETKEESKPAKAKDGELQAEASGGTGAVTVGPYGSDIGGAPLRNSDGKYIDVYRSTSATFQKIEFKDCELGGAKTIWWYDEATGRWLPISEPTAVYTATPTPCITVTITQTSTPDVEQMTGMRYGLGEAPGVQEYGKCLGVKGGYYKEGNCQTLDEKSGKVVQKGKFEWYPAPSDCYAKKKGHYAESRCLTPDEKKGKPKGKYEKGSELFTGSSGEVKLELKGAGTIKCTSSRAEGVLAGLKTATETITYSGCKREGSECTSSGLQAGTIRTGALETLTYEQDGKYLTGIAGNPIATFTCASTTFTLRGEVSGETTGNLNVDSTKEETVFKPGSGYQGLKAEDTSGSFETTLSATMTTAAAEAFEISEKAKG